jgi:hypothetical protein
VVFCAMKRAKKSEVLDNDSRALAQAEKRKRIRDEQNEDPKATKRDQLYLTYFFFCVIFCLCFLPNKLCAGWVRVRDLVRHA